MDENKYSNKDFAAKLSNDQKCEEKIKQLFWDRYSFYSSEVSKICRQLAFAEGAIIGYFGFLKEHVSVLMLLILILLLLYFIADIIQYIIGANEHKKVAYKYENELLQQNTALTPDKINKDDIVVKKIELFFILKLIFLSVSSVLLLSQMIILMYGC